jgi:hypothetical protein
VEDGMSEMIERVAKALYARRPNGQGIPGGQWHVDPWEKIGDAMQAEHRAAARAAIGAMREPTEGMHDAGAVAYYRHNKKDEYLAYGLADEMFSAMIDAALK